MKNLQKGFAVQLLIVIIILVFIGGGVYIYESKKVEVPIVEDSAIQQPSPTQAIKAPSNNFGNNGSFEITWPTEGSVLEAGRTYLIKWNGIDSRVKNYEIYLWKESEQITNGSQGTGYVNVIASMANPVSITNNSFSWTIPLTVKTGSDYRIDFSNVGAPQETRSKRFSIVNNILSAKQSVTVISPNGDEKLKVGESFKIKWMSNVRVVSRAVLYLLSGSKCPPGYHCTPLPNTMAVIAKLDSTSANLGSYEWIVNTSNVKDYGNGYYMKVVLFDDSGKTFVDESDSYFSII